MVHAVIGPADLQLHARGPNGFDEHLLTRWNISPASSRPRLFLEQTATVSAQTAVEETVTVAGTNVGLALLDGLCTHPA